MGGRQQIHILFVLCPMDQSKEQIFWTDSENISCAQAIPWIFSNRAKWPAWYLLIYPVSVNGWFWITSGQGRSFQLKAILQRRGQLWAINSQHPQQLWKGCSDLACDGVDQQNSVYHRRWKQVFHFGHGTFETNLRYPESSKQLEILWLRRGVWTRHINLVAVSI